MLSPYFQDALINCYSRCMDNYHQPTIHTADFWGQTAQSIIGHIEFEHMI